jgi:hypothetical protein
MFLNMVKQIEESHFLIIKEKNDEKFAKAVNESLNLGWQLVNVVRPGFNQDHVGYLTRK